MSRCSQAAWAVLMVMAVSTIALIAGFHGRPSALGVRSPEPGSIVRVPEGRHEPRVEFAVLGQLGVNGAPAVEPSFDDSYVGSLLDMLGLSGGRGSIAEDRTDRPRDRAIRYRYLSADGTTRLEIAPLLIAWRTLGGLSRSVTASFPQDLGGGASHGAVRARECCPAVSALGAAAAAAAAMLASTLAGLGYVVWRQWQRHSPPVVGAKAQPDRRRLPASAVS